jgi:hypothetical protein
MCAVSRFDSLPDTTADRPARTLIYFVYIFNECNGRVRHFDGTECAKLRGKPFLSEDYEGKAELYECQRHMKGLTVLPRLI